MPAIIPLPAFSDNYIWAIRAGDRAVVVDPGDEGPVESWLERERVELVAILVTHHHPDHTGGVAALARGRPITVFGPARESIPACTRPVGGGERIVLPGMALSLEVVDVPGHTAGHVAYVGSRRDWGDPVLFCGDTLFAGGCGRLFEGTAEVMHASLAKLAALAPDTRVYCAHEYTIANLRFAAAVEPGNPGIAARVERELAKREAGLPTVPSTLADEAATNPFLRARVPAVAAAAVARAGHALDGEVGVFAALRAWKNVF